MKKTPQVKTKMSPLMKVVKAIYKFFTPRYTVEYKQPITSRCILLGTHHGASGPVLYTSHMDEFCLPWGAHEMMGNYIMRWNYAYHVFYRQKLGKGKVTSFIRATLLALVVKIAYSGVGLISTYQDSRQKQAVKQSISAIEQQVPVLIFPEDSANGYDEQITHCHAGFVLLARQYFVKNGIDVPVYPTRLDIAKRKIFVGEPMYVNEMLSQGLTREEIADRFCKAINQTGN